MTAQVKPSSEWVKCFITFTLDDLRGEGGGLPENLGRGVRPASQKPYPIIFDQNLRFSLPYLWPDKKLYTLFMTWLFLLRALSSLRSRRDEVMKGNARMGGEGCENQIED